MPGLGDKYRPLLRGLPLACAFCLILALPSLVLLATPRAAVSMAEKRQLAAFPPPPVNMQAARAFPAGFEAWFNDHFGLRGPLVTAHSLVLLRLLGTSPNAEVAVGRDGWLFFGGGVAESYRGMPQLNPQLPANFQRVLEAKRDWLAEHGIRYLFVIPPDKQSIYSEYVREAPIGPTPTDHLLAHMRAHSDVEIVDLRPLLLAKKAEIGVLYMRTDTHWNGWGAYLGYRATVEKLAGWYPSLHPPLRPLEPETVGFRHRPSRGGDMASQLNLVEWLGDEEVDIPRETAGGCATPTPVTLVAPRPFIPSQAPFSTHCTGGAPLRVLFLRDSFANSQIPLFARTFADVTYVWLSSVDHPPWEAFTTIRQVVARQPVDVVVDQMVERKLLAFPLRTDPAFMAATARRQFAMAAPEEARSVAPLPVQQVAVSGDSGGFRMRPTGGTPVIALRLATPLAGRWPVVRLALTCPADTALTVKYQTPGGWSELLVPVAAGRGDAVFEISSAHSSGVLLVRLGNGEGEFILHQVEVRAGRRDIRVPTPTTRLVAQSGSGG